MRESIGGTWLFGIVAVFISLFTGFLAYSISYTRAFNVKNQIISIIEENEGYKEYSGSDDLSKYSLKQLEDIKPQTDDNGSITEIPTEVSILKAIKRAGYNHTATTNIDCSSFGHDGKENILGEKKNGKLPPKVGGYCITKVCVDDPNDTNDNGKYEGRTYYKVTTFIAIDFPIINATFKIPVSGETDTLYYDISENAYCPTNGN